MKSNSLQKRFFLSDLDERLQKSYAASGRSSYPRFGWHPRCIPHFSTWSQPSARAMASRLSNSAASPPAPSRAPRLPNAEIKDMEEMAELNTLTGQPMASQAIANAFLLPSLVVSRWEDAPDVQKGADTGARCCCRAGPSTSCYGVLSSTLAFPT